MITLDQIKQLDTKVRKAIDKINSLKSENSMLQDKLETYQLRIEELEILIDTFKEDQGEIEHGIIDALNQLDTLEENVIVPEESSQEEEEEEEEKEEETPSETEEESDNSDQETTEVDKETESDKETLETTEKSADSEIELDIF